MQRDVKRLAPLLGLYVKIIFMFKYKFSESEVKYEGNANLLLDCISSILTCLNLET